MNMKQIALGALTAGVLALGSALPAAATPLDKIAPAHAGSTLEMRHGGHHGGWHRGGRGHHYGWNRGHRGHHGWHRGHHRGWR